MFKRLLFLCFISFSLNLFSAKKDTIVVTKDNSGDFSSIQEAIDQSQSFPYKKLVIFIKKGTYKEKIKVHEWNTNLTFIGENKYKTIITFDDYFDKMKKGKNSTFYTPTFFIEANDTVLKNLTIENSAGEVGQAVALSVFANRVSVINCKLLGNQDTLYVSGEGRQFFKNCYIEGTTDFIFGNATAFFEDCEIHSKKNSYITAASTPENSEFGLVFYHCKLISEPNIEKVYLGRPWRIFAKTVFIECDLGNHIRPEGWNNWNKTEAEQTSFYAEFQNKGKSADTKSRVKWAHQLSKKEAKLYTEKNILKDSISTNWYENF